MKIKEVTQKVFEDNTTAKIISFDKSKGTVAATLPNNTQIQGQLGQNVKIVNGKPVFDLAAATAPAGQPNAAPTQQQSPEQLLTPGADISVSTDPNQSVPTQSNTSNTEVQTQEEIGNIGQDRIRKDRPGKDIGGDPTDDYIHDLKSEDGNQEFDPSWLNGDDVPGSVGYLQPGDKGLNSKDPGVQTLYPAQMTPELRRKYQIANFQKQNPGVPLPVELGGPGMPNNESVELTAIKRLSGL